MKAKDYFERIRMLQADMKLTQSQIVRMRELLDVQSVVYGEKVSTSGADEPKIPVIIADLMVYIQELEETQKHYLEEHKQAMNVISNVARPDYKKVLTLRYLDNKSFREIAKELGYSASGARKMCEKAVRYVDPQLKRLLLLNKP